MMDGSVLSIPFCQPTVWIPQPQPINSTLDMFIKIHTSVNLWVRGGVQQSKPRTNQSIDGKTGFSYYTANAVPLSTVSDGF